MGCSCGSGTPKYAPGSFTVVYADGHTAAYRSEVEAIAEAARNAGAKVVSAG